MDNCSAIVIAIFMSHGVASSKNDIRVTDMVRRQIQRHSDDVELSLQLCPLEQGSWTVACALPS